MTESIIVSLTSEPRVLIEEEGTTATVNLSLSEPPPAEGVDITIDAAEMIEFDPKTLVVSDGVQPVSANEDNTQFTLRLFVQEASLSVDVVDDGEDEGLETAVFSLGDGDYQIDPDAASGTFTIFDTADQIPEVSFEIEPNVVSEEDEPASFTGTFTVDGEIPEGGLSVLFDNTPSNIFGQTVGAPIIEGFNFGTIFDPELNALEFVLLENTATFTLNIFNDIIQEEPEDFTFAVLPDETGILNSIYTVNPDAGSDTVTLIDGNGGPGVGPTVSLSVSDTDLVEGDSLTVNFDVDGEIPDGGLQVFVAGGPTDVGEFVIFNEDGSPAVELEGINEFPLQGGIEGGFFVTLAENQASLTLSVFEDGGGEGEEELTFSLANGEEYEVAPGAGEVTLTINDFNEIDSTDGNDRLNGTDSNDLILAGDGANRVNGGAGNDVIAGGDDLDRLNGDDGNDSIFGGERTDRINGGAGDDLLSGDGGNDEIRGGDGDDLLMGVTGNDTLIGEAGSDTFVFGNGDGTDRINDFDPSEDLIGLVDGELTFADITLTQEGNNTILGVSGTGEELALLVKVSADAITDDSFVTVPDISDISDVL
ncbi:MAG: calcium-binding protein [Cyanobacteria bacterium P01_G01_bin.19]